MTLDGIMAIIWHYITGIGSFGGRLITLQWLYLDQYCLQQGKELVSGNIRRH